MSSPFEHPGMSGRFLSEHEQKVAQLEARLRDYQFITAALLQRLYPEHAQRGVDITLLPHEMEQTHGWTIAVYRGIGLATVPPVRVVMTRPHQTVAGGVVPDRGEIEGGVPRGDASPDR